MDIEKETLTIDLPTNDYLSRCKLSLEFHTVQTILDLVRRVSLVSHKIRAGKQTTTKYDGTWNTMLVDYCFFSLSLSRWNCVSISQRFLFCVTVCHTQLMVFFSFSRYLALFIRTLNVVTLLNTTLHGIKSK